MSTEKRSNNKLLYLMWLMEGILIGFGAILPGVSGGTLCVAFGMYKPIMETITDIRGGIKKHGIKLMVFALGALLGFVGLSGLAAWLLEQNIAVITCVFIGLIIGTFPELWKDAGRQGRTNGSYIALTSGFIAMLLLLTLLKTRLDFEIAPNFWGFLLCGVLWGLSFIIPGLSSSTLLLFFGLYQPMLKGIAAFDFSVLIPMGLGMLACVIPLSRFIRKAYEKQYNLISHSILGIVGATAVMIFPAADGSAGNFAIWLIAVIVGAVASFGLSRLCEKISGKSV